MNDSIISLNKLQRDYSIKIKQSFWKDVLFPRYKNVSAIKNISFSIDRGESVALLGPNGAGKTTIMKILSGLLFPTSGKVEVLNFFPFDRKNEYLKRIGLVMGNRSGLAWDLTPNQNFELAKKIYGISDHNFLERVARLTAMLSVEKFLDKQVRKLSLGERMKLELVASLLHNPEILYLDEPTIGLDIISKQRIRSFLRDIQRDLKITLLLTSHDMDDVEKVSDRVIVINHGQIVFDDSMPKLLRNYQDKKYLTLVLTETVAPQVIEKYGKIVDHKPLTYTIEISKAKQSKTIADIMENLPIDDIDIIHVPLEEIIADMFTGKPS
ncbi:TPA: ABC transporter [Candidatus Collierbacteria bacterium]|uniref:ABC transporter n=1 Tax=Candidatus Collierbacteria bacterium GW2011_GWB2_44_22 TaxID=1618387 RepID=A0A0G1HY12_9BACT|nr:MAG: ABC transporter [Candidatus Collierbacteria bacterium GW2011_GWA2_44_13]KKT50710.1 MAG: ABC transporter [Candidatus Collierbacteria bacterium GW2011_GWB1_44_197]KKT52031.1 MAG: ABC transporter [Candidatus Collierbacteria bacterium GW2011_GWB2_44_22]KKT62637.1 MAG: ABC transporter [Candidatus Collierbacteria bacterium GW2011_GWD1_44_27]KKT66680.1 MAG: ABC transporter [Candidatus Collierbacteria bacterium GW2011_GWC2_44_30]KKT69372.1 MAG: ABC transporter [Microgenomates group bacterium G